MSLWLVGKKRSITLMAPQSANGTAMNMTTRIAISRLVILFIFLPASNRYLRSTLFRNISLPRDPALLRTLQRRPAYSRADSRKARAGAIEGNKTEAAINHRHKKKPRPMPGLELPEKLDQYLATTGPPQSKVEFPPTRPMRARAAALA